MHRIRLLAATAVIGIGMGIGCHAEESVPSATAPPSSASPKTLPKIKGTLTAAATGELWKDGGVVYVEDAPKHVVRSAAIEIRKREFSPPITVVTTGGTVTFTNRETLTHHVFSPDIPNWDTGYLKVNDAATKEFEKAGVYSILCNIHTEMLGYVVVVPSTYFSIVNAGGEYVIGDLPAGTYKVTAWAPRTKPVTQSVTVDASGTATVNFEMR